MTSAVGAGGHRKQCNGQHCANGPAHLISFPGHPCNANATIFEKDTVDRLFQAWCRADHADADRPDATRVRRGPTHPSSSRARRHAGLSGRGSGGADRQWVVSCLVAPRSSERRRPAADGRDGPGYRGLRSPRPARFTIFKERRIDVPLDKVSPNVVAALLAIEDQRFYDHEGFDLIRIASAALANLRGRAAQGGSTITQQLARQSFLTPDKTSGASCRNWCSPRGSSGVFEAGDLELYLNKVYFGDGL